MDRFKCRTCGMESMVNIEVEVEEGLDAPPLEDSTQDSEFVSCHVCGDNWLSIRELGVHRVRMTFLHQMGMSPLLKCVGHIVPGDTFDDDDEEWEFFVDDEVVDEDAWEGLLAERREVLRSVCSN
jgi:hypothetical protein